MANEIQNTGIQFEDIVPWINDSGDTGLSARLKLKRNFDKIKAWMDSQGMDIEDVRQMIIEMGAELFLSKVDDDTAAGNISFLQNIGVGGNATIDGILQALARVITNSIESSNYNGDGPFDSGYKMHKDGSGITHLVVDNLFVRMKAIFTELEIRKISYAGGNIIFSHAGSKVVMVHEIGDVADCSFTGTTATINGAADFTNQQLNVHASAEFDGGTLKFNNEGKVVAYRCYIMKDDGTTQTENWWRVDDQARCQTFNIKEGVYQHVGNSFYWRRVIGVGTEVPDGANEEYDYVDLSVEDAIAGSTIPQPGDQLVQMGNRTDTGRQGFITIEVSDQGEHMAPAFKVYKNVNSYTLDGKRKICISPKYTEIRAQKFVTETDYDVMQLPNQRTEAWYLGMQCYYYDLVQHNGSTWLCIYPESGIGGVMFTTDEPSESSPYWRIHSGKGENGESIVSVYAWNQDPDNAPAISGNDYPPAGWTIRATDRPADGYYLWMAESIRYSDGSIAPWGAPVRISGDTGSPGEDAKNIEWIYRLDTSVGYNDKTDNRGKTFQDDDFVPINWSDNALSISESHKNLYAASRKYNTTTKQWGDFSTPIVWSHWGERGIDGDGVEYVFVRTNTATPPTITNSDDTYQGKTYLDDDYLPLSSVGRCTDDQAGTDENHQYEWAAIRRKAAPDANGHRAWQKYSGTMKLWNNYAKSVQYDAEHSSLSYAISAYGVAEVGRDYPSDITSWSTTVPTPQQGKYLWTRDTTAYDNGGTLEYDVTYGVSYYAIDGSSVKIDTTRTFVKYSTQKTASKPADSTFTLDTQPALAQGDYLWILSQTAYVGVTSVLKSYSVSRLGADGGEGDPGADGYTTHFAYATSADGQQNFSTSNFRGATYIGTYRDQLAVDSTNYRDYTWTEWKGDKGDSVAVAVCFPATVSIPTDGNGRVLEDFRKEVIVQMTTNTQSLSLTNVSILQGGANVDLSATTLESHAPSQTTFSGNTAVIGDASFSNTTLVVEDYGSTLVSKSLVVSAARGTLLTEHDCEIQAQAYDADMAIYTARTSLVVQRNVRGTDGDGRDGRDGTDGVDAYSVIATPSSLIVNQDLNNTTNLSNLSERIVFSAVKGSTQLSVVRVDVTAASHCTVTGSISNYATITAIQVNQSTGNYYDTADITCRVTFTDGSTTRSIEGIVVRIYANLLGTWKQTVEAGEEQIAASKVVYALGASGGTIEAIRTDYTSKRNSIGSYETWSSGPADTDGSKANMIKKTTTAQSTADGVSTKVSAITTTSGGTTHVKESEVTQYSDQITLTVRNGLSDTGIDIVNKKITIKSNKVDFKDSQGNPAKFSINGQDGSMKAEGGGSIGGFDIGTTSIGKNGTIISGEDGYTYLERNGRLKLFKNSGSNKDALEVYGGAAIVGQGNRPVTISNDSGSTVDIHGKEVNINTTTLSNAATNIGHNNGSLGINAGTTNINSATTNINSTNVNVSGTFNVSGVFANPDAIKISNFTLPPSPKKGQLFFVKGISSDVTVTIPSGQRVYKQNDDSYSTGSVNLEKNATILVCIDATKKYWARFYCG